MITKHRIRRSRTQPEPGTPGAPFLGAFACYIANIAKVGGTAELYPVDINSEGSEENPPTWLPAKNIHPSAFKLFLDGELAEVNSAIVDGTGQSIAISFPGGAADVILMALPGDRELIATNGTVCGGAFGSG